MSQESSARPTVVAVVGSPAAGRATRPGRSMSRWRSWNGAACTPRSSCSATTGSIRVRVTRTARRCRPARCEDDAAAILDRVYGADGLILATPVYYEDVSAQMKAFIDRNYRPYELQQRLQPKVVGLVVVAAETGIEETVAALKRFLALSWQEPMPIEVASGFASRSGRCGPVRGAARGGHAHGRADGRHPAGLRRPAGHSGGRVAGAVRRLADAGAAQHAPLGHDEVGAQVVRLARHAADDLIVEGQSDAGGARREPAQERVVEAAAVAHPSALRRRRRRRAAPRRRCCRGSTSGRPGRGSGMSQWPGCRSLRSVMRTATMCRGPRTSGTAVTRPRRSAQRRMPSGVDLGAKGREAEERAGAAHGRDAQETPADGGAAPCPLVVSELVAARERFPAYGVFARFGVRHADPRSGRHWRAAAQLVAPGSS